MISLGEYLTSLLAELGTDRCWPRPDELSMWLTTLGVTDRALCEAAFGLYIAKLRLALVWIENLLGVPKSIIIERLVMAAVPNLGRAPYVESNSSDLAFAVYTSLPVMGLER